MARLRSGGLAFVGVFCVGALMSCSDGGSTSGGSATRLEACLAIDLVVAWRIFHLAKLGREVPEVPCTVFFEDAEWKALVVRVKQTRNLPASPPSLREAVRMVASLGGFLGRKADGEPGTQSLWLGLQRLDDITAMYQLLTGDTGPPGVQPSYG